MTKWLNRIFSLAEQDLAFRASVFVGSSQSEWAKMISIDRFDTISNSKIECSILEYMVNAKAIGFRFFQVMWKVFLKLTFKVVFWNISQNVQITISRSGRLRVNIWAHWDPKFSARRRPFWVRMGTKSKPNKVYSDSTTKRKQTRTWSGLTGRSNEPLFITTVTAHITAFYLYIFILC